MFDPDRLFDPAPIFLMFEPSAGLYFGVALVAIAFAKWINDRLTPYSLREELTTKDNKAVALSFGGYLFAVLYIVWSVMGSPTAMDVADANFVWRDLGSTLIWSLLGIGLLQVSRIINNKLLLPQFDNFKELVEDHNLGTGAVQAGTYIGTALMIRPVVSGEGQGEFLVDLGLMGLYFVLGQLAFIVFGVLYQRVGKFDLHGEIEKDNASAGVSFGMTLVAVGIALSGYLLNHDSLLGFLVWFVASAFLLILARVLVDRFVLPGAPLDDEVQDDQNWGAALIEGAVAIGLALILVASFTSAPPTAL